MGKGDKKSKKGKLSMGSFGNSRPHKEKKSVTPKKKVAVAKTAEEKPKKAAAPKKAKAE